MPDTNPPEPARRTTGEVEIPVENARVSGTLPTVASAVVTLLVCAGAWFAVRSTAVQADTRSAATDAKIAQEVAPKLEQATKDIAVLQATKEAAEKRTDQRFEELKAQMATNQAQVLEEIRALRRTK